MGVKDAMHKASPCRLEPAMKVDVVMPEEHLGDVMGDLASRRGHLLGLERHGTYANLRAHCPPAGMLGYPTELPSVTSARATHSLEFRRYEDTPGNLPEDRGPP